LVDFLITDFLIEFTNEGRYEVFKSIFKTKKRHSEIEKELDLPGPEISRNIKRLLKKELIKKQVSGEYEMTSTGIIVHEILKMLEKILGLTDFLNNHDITAIPINLMLQMGKLDSINIEDQTMVNIQKWADLVKSAEEFIISISDQFQDSILPIIEKKISNQTIDIKAIVDASLLKDSIKVGKIFKDRHEVYNKMDAFQNVKVLEKVNLSLLGTEKGAIIFLSSKDKVDYSLCLHDDSESFIEWTKDLFHWYWKNGKDLKSFIKS